METHFYAGPGHVIVDSCENCSELWLDGGELMRIVHASGSESDLPSVPPVPMPGDPGWVGSPFAESPGEIVTDAIIDTLGRSFFR